MYDKLSETGAATKIGMAAKQSLLEDVLLRIQGHNGQLHEHHRRLANINDKVIGYGPEDPSSDINDKDTNGMIDSMMQALIFQQKLIDRLSSQIDRLQTL